MNLVRHAVAALVSACLLAACGGGGGTDTTSAPASSSIASTVRLEGCVQGTAAAVQALGDDGRLLATTNADAQGVFTLQVPARHHITLRLDTGDGSGLELLTGSSNLSLTGCLNASA